MVPTQKKSKCRKRTRRSHHSLRVVNLAACPKCGTAKLPHASCETCGYASPKVALPAKSEES